MFAVVSLISSAVGFFIFLFLNRSSFVREIKQARSIAKDLLYEAENKETLIRNEARSQIQEYKISLKEKFKDEVQQLKEKSAARQSLIDKAVYRNKIYIQNLEREVKERQLDFLEVKKKFEEKQAAGGDLLEKEKTERKKYLNQLTEKFSFNTEAFRIEMEKKPLEQAVQKARWKAQKFSDNFQKDLEKNTIYFLEMILSRFKRKCSDERGIRPIQIKNKKIFNELLSRGRSHLDFLEKECGVDIIVDDQELTLNVQGLDPVRREWGRVSLEKLSKKRRIHKGIISNILTRTKRELFRKIRKDGQRICLDLKLKNTPSEIKNMMGALRYRYSFAQNQHFHCEEVGWLCGMMMTELGGSVEKGRKAGLFHDIGKAMDHAQTGGHAVIGADFIQKHGQEDDIVYAVRGHHHDVPPKHNLDFLVIAADAVSGSRPGARRSTVDSYHQKVTSLEKIGKSFNGVRDVYIMNAGREMRLIVDSRQVSDLQALELSKKAAERIEQECSYPGWIKVNVVRKYEVHQTTRTRAAK